MVVKSHPHPSHRSHGGPCLSLQLPGHDLLSGSRLSQPMKLIPDSLALVATSAEAAYFRQHPAHVLLFQC